MIKDITLKWWQAALYELSVISFGIIIGSYWSGFWTNWTNILWFTFAIPGIYILYMWIKQQS